MLHAAITAYARRLHRQWDAVDLREHQERTLLDLIENAAGTTFYEAHGLDQVRSVVDYQERVPIRDFAAFDAEWLQPYTPNLTGVLTNHRIRFLAESSGTSGGQLKFLPVSDAQLAGGAASSRAQVMFASAALGSARPFMRPFLTLTDPGPLVDVAPGVQAGPITKIIMKQLPWFVRRRSVYESTPAGGDLDRIVEAAVRQDLGLLTGVTPWLLEFARRSLEATGKRSLRDIWPNLGVVGHGGVAPLPYAAQLAALLDGQGIVAVEAYAASEGYIAFHDALHGGLRVSLASRMLLEFVPVAEVGTERPTRLLLHQVEAGQPYAIVLTTPSGLWSYLLGDIVEFSSTRPPLLTVTGRLGSSLDTWGEHTTEDALNRAITAATAEHGVDLIDFHVSPVVDGRSARGRYQLLLECVRPPHDPAALGAALDRELAYNNPDYGKLRSPKVGLLRAPEVIWLPRGTFARWLSTSTRGLQRKVPRIGASDALARQLMSTLAAAPSGAAARPSPGPW